ncbi:MAG: hypothetical protein L0Z50_09150 [Verrucomicrobiales bacterium]|nr:hypothetical protein [Verrucomicrobiales bacterium]
MRVFVGYGYNERDKWIEDQVFPILRYVGFTVAHGKDLHGKELSPEVKLRIDQSDAVIGFFTIREGQGAADFTSHIWVRDEMVYAMAKGKPIVPIREKGVNMPDALLGNLQSIPLDQNDRLGCVAELLNALGHRKLRRVRLDPANDELRASLWLLRKTPGFVVRYRTQDSEGNESNFREGRLELVDQGFYLNVIDVPQKAYVDVEGLLNGNLKFGSGWVSADAVQVKIF